MKEWLARHLLPVCFDKPLFAPNPDTTVPTAFKNAVQEALGFGSNSYSLQSAVRNALKLLGADVRDRVPFCVGNRQYEKELGKVGYLGADLRVIFFSTDYLYGIPFLAVDETPAWNAARDGKELQLNELMAMILASQYTLQNTRAAQKEVSQT